MKMNYIQIAITNNNQKNNIIPKKSVCTTTRHTNNNRKTMKKIISNNNVKIATAKAVIVKTITTIACLFSIQFSTLMLTIQRKIHTLMKQTTIFVIIILVIQWPRVSVVQRKVMQKVVCKKKISQSLIIVHIRQLIAIIVIMKKKIFLLPRHSQCLM